MRSIFHIGPGKSGSSAIQTFLAKNRDKLGSIGILYPKDASTDVALQGQTTSGNRQALVEYDFQITSDECLDAIIFSSEYFVWDLYRNNPTGRKIIAQGNNGKVIVVVRDLFEHLSSSWKQKIKSNGEFYSIKEFLESHYRVYEVTAKVIDECQRHGLEILVLNYSRERRKIVSSFIKAAFPDLTSEDLKYFRSENITVNRSLSESELALQRELNKRLGKRARWFAMALVEVLPDVPAAPIRLTDEEIFLAIEMNRHAIERINERLPADSHIRILPSEAIRITKDNDDFRFSAAQLEVIAKVFSDQLTRRK